MAKETKSRKDVDDLFTESENELKEEIIKAAKGRIKNLLRVKAKAENVVNNVNREISELKLEIEHELGA